MSAATLITAAYNRMAYGKLPDWATQAQLILESGNFIATFVLSVVAGCLRFNSPMVLARAVSVTWRKANASLL